MRGNDSEIRRRIQRWHRTGDMGALWPEFSVAELLAGHGAVCATTRAMLREPSATATLEATSERESAALGIAAFESGMGPLLGWWVERGLVTASTGARQVLAVHLEHGRRRIAAIRQALTAILQALHSEGVIPVLLKGLHVGSEYFPEPGTCPAGDIDLLVHPSERDAAAAGLRRAGLRESRRTVYGARSEWVPDGRAQVVHSLEFDHADNPFAVDLHTGLERWYFRGVRAGFGESAFAHTTPIVVDGSTVRALDQPLLTAFLALHTSSELARMRLVRLVELTVVIQRDRRSGVLDWTALGGLLHRTGTARFVFPALALVERLCPGTVENTLIARSQPYLTNRMLRVIEAVAAADMAPLRYRSLEERLVWARGARELLLNLSELVWPTDDGLPVSVGRLQWRRVRALVRGRVGLRAR
ncbi:MAG: nucleotidyltransferase family protein [Gemmatimonadetes bacterium]|nr:nucleotidyltransferase family protein [Gemmatimonadota bacterium]